MLVGRGGVKDVNDPMLEVSAMKRPHFQSLRVYQLSERLADEVWRVVKGWGGGIASRTIGEQLVRAADSVGANIAEGAGRGTYKDNKRFILIARGPLYETQHWLRRAFQRQLLSQNEVESLRTILNELPPKLNAYLRSIGKPRKQPEPAPQPTA
jgi:four helix bundle protein